MLNQAFSKYQMDETILMNYCIAHPFSCQNEILFKLLTENKDTQIGKKYSFAKMKKISDFTSTVPLYTYEDINNLLAKNSNKTNILTQEPICYYAQTSGSTGTSKLIPHTKSSLRAWSTGGTRCYFSYLDKTNNDGFQINKSKMIPTVAPDLIKTENGIPVGYISGIAASTSRITNMLNPIPKELTTITDQEKRLLETAKIILKEDVYTLAGISNFSIQLLNYIKYKAATQLENIDEYKDILREVTNENKEIDIQKLWPNLKVFVSTGILAEQISPLVRKFLRDVYISDFYGASEGAYGFSQYKGTPGITLNLDLYFFEFRDIETDEICTIETVKLHRKYEPIITAPNGLYRYPNEDMITFVCLAPFTIQVLGRITTVVNLMGEKIDEYDISSSVNDTLRKLHTASNGFLFFGWNDSEFAPHHILALELTSSDETISLNSLAEAIKSNLTLKNAAYATYSLRSLINAPHIILLKPGTMQALQKFRAQKAGCFGHSKVKKIVSSEEALSILKRSYILMDNLPDSFKIKLG